MSALDQRIADLPPEKRALLSLRLKNKNKKTPLAGERGIPSRADKLRWPLSFAQQRLWFLDQLEPESPLYNISGLLSLSGPLDVRALHDSMQMIVRRHEALRANFVDVAGKPVQYVNEKIELPLPLIDLQHLSPEAQRAEVQRMAKEGAQRPFNLRQDLLLRTALFGLQPGEYVLLLTVHHIAFDGWSTNIFVQELMTLYADFKDGHSPTLPPLGIQYADYAQWQRQQLADDNFEQQLDYWQAQLGSSPPILELPTDKPRLPVPAHCGVQHQFSLDPTLHAQLKALALAENVTLFMLLLTALTCCCTATPISRILVLVPPLPTAPDPK